MVKPTNPTANTVTKPSTSAETAKDPSTGSTAATPETPAEPQGEKGGKKAREKRHPYTVQLSPTTWKRAKLLASLSGTTVSKMVEQDLTKRITADLKVLLEGLDKTEGE